MFDIPIMVVNNLLYMDNNFAMNTLAAAGGTGGTFFLHDVNPALGFICGILTLIHISIALYKQNKNDRK
jgi:hypothetical protein